VESEDVTKKHNEHIDMYILGGVLDDYQLRNTAMQELINMVSYMTKVPSFATIGYVYDRTPWDHL